MNQSSLLTGSTDSIITCSSLYICILRLEPCAQETLWSGERYRCILWVNAAIVMHCGERGVTPGGSPGFGHLAQARAGKCSVKTYLRREERPALVEGSSDKDRWTGHLECREWPKAGAMKWHLCQKQPCGSQGCSPHVTGPESDPLLTVKSKYRASLVWMLCLPMSGSWFKCKTKQKCG